jgi:hypothetical protein
VFSEKALRELQGIRRSRYEGDRVLAEAAWSLARWEAFHGNHEAALDHAIFMRTASKSKRGHKGQVLLEAECLCELGQEEEAIRVLHDQIARKGRDADLMFALAAAHACRNGGAEVESEQLKIVNQVYMDSGFAGIEKKSQDEGLNIFNIQGVQSKVESASSSELVSIIMPAFNAADTISNAIDSVLSQTWENLELIVVDDCSSDDTFEVIKKFAERDARVIPVRHEINRGAYPARNTGLIRATGAASPIDS